MRESTESRAMQYTRMIEGNTGEISDRRYNLIIGGCLLWGFLCNIFIIATMTPFILSLSFWVVIIGYIVCCFAGITIYNKSDNPYISFLGYNLIVLPVGVVLTYIVFDIDPYIVFQAMVITSGVTLLMMLVSSIYPNAFMKMGGVLFIALLSVFIMELVAIFLFKMHPTIFDWAVALIFCGYIGYDWAVANHIEKTADNAVDSAAKLYLDIINLFIRILSILNRR